MMTVRGYPGRGAPASRAPSAARPGGTAPTASRSGCVSGFGGIRFLFGSAYAVGSALVVAVRDGACTKVVTTWLDLIPVGSELRAKPLEPHGAGWWARRLTSGLMRR